MRPFPISLLSVVFLLIGSIMLWGMLRTLAGSMAPTHPIWVYIGMSAQYLGTAIGLWRMRRWAFLLYGVLWFVMALTVLVVDHKFNFYSLAGPLMLGIVYFAYRHRLGANNSFKPKPLRGSD